MNSLRRILLILLLTVTMTVTNSYAQPAHDECGCCTEAQLMLCAACKVCTTPGLTATLPILVINPDIEIVATILRFNPSRHTEDIWHPPRQQS